MMAMSFALDHDYCSAAPSDKDSKPDTPSDTDATRPKAKRKEVLCPRVDPDMESLPIDARSSSLSPAHSMDSGVDAGVEDFLADFATSWVDEDFGLNEEDIKDLEALLLSENIQANELPTVKSANSGVAETSRFSKLNVQSGKGQQISEEDEKAIAERNKRNAIAARENRQKKKKYVEGLENDVAKLKEENKTLKTRNESTTTMIKKLSDEVKYLRSVLANESTISLLLKSVASTPGIALSSSLMQSSGSEGNEKENKEEGEKQYVTRSKKRRSDDCLETTLSKRTRSSSTGGVCLHVNHGIVSLELCAKCERKASQSGFL